MSTMLPCVKACQAGDPAIHHVTTPMKNEFDLRLLSYGQMALHGQVPNRFADLAIASEYDPSKLQPEKPDIEFLVEFDAFKSWCVTASIVPEPDYEYVHGYDEEGKRVDVQMPREDRDYLWLVASRQEPIDGARETFLENLDLMSKFREQFASPVVPQDMPNKGPRPRRRAGN